MCQCTNCLQWVKDARGHNGSLRCKNPQGHCICCHNNHQDCSRCNHFQVPLMHVDIHFHANIGKEEEWEVIDHMICQLYIN